MGAFEELHQRRITDSLAMYDRMIFKGHLTALFRQDGARCYLWSQGVALKDLTPYAKPPPHRSPITAGPWPPRPGAPSSPLITCGPGTAPSTKTTWPSRSPNAMG